MKKVLMIDSADNVAVALEALEAGDEFEVGTDGAERHLSVRDSVPFGHKVALWDISAEETIIKYGYSIGTATENIKAGEHVHVHNLKGGRA